MKKIIFYILLIISVPELFCQETKDKPKSEPVDLPEIIITEEARLFTSSGVKQFPGSPLTLNTSELDSLNSLEKQQPLLIPNEPLPERILDTIQTKGFLRGEFGRYTTPSLEAGYAFQFQDYKLYGEGGFESSNGHIENADYTKLNLKLLSDYIASDKFFIFGGSATHTDIRLMNKSYNLYSMSEPVYRNLFNFNASVDVDGRYESFTFNTGAGFENLNIYQTNASAGDNQFIGYLAVSNFWRKLIVGAKLNLDYHSYKGTGMHFSEIQALAAYTFDRLRLSANGGFQIARSSTEIDRGGFNLSGSVFYNLDRLITLRGTISTGLERNSFIHQAKQNPYISDSAIIDFPYNINSLKFNVTFHPTESLNFDAGLRTGIYNRFASFVAADTGTFIVNYQDARLLDIAAEGYWDITSNDRLIGNLNYYILRSGENNKALPYIPQSKISVSYYKLWFAQFGTQFGLTYFGTRFADINNKKMLNDYFNISINIKYRFSDILNLYANFENISNSDIYVWEGYKERNLYLSLGVLWQF